jgi:hypothetical protein
MRTKIRFLLKFLVLVALLLPLWLNWGVEPYLGVLAHQTAWLLRLTGYTIYGSAADATRILLQVEPESSLAFEALGATLNLVVFPALLFASSGLGWRRRLGFLVAGLATLHGFNVMYFTAHFVVNYRYGQNSSAFQALKSISESFYLVLPFVLWLLMEAPRIFRHRRRPTPAADQAV